MAGNLPRLAVHPVWPGLEDPVGYIQGREADLYARE